MVQIMIIGSVILLLCVASSKLLYRFGVSTLLIALVLGMLFGSDGIVGIQFDDYALAQQLCSFGLVFIMFYGGFGTSWKAAKPVAKPAILMSTLGVVITAILTGLFCTLVLQCSVWQGLLMGSVVASTDAASVFAVLRSRKLNLKGGLASLLELESGSNDPISYMLTIVFIAVLTGNYGAGEIGIMLVKQIVFGLALGVLFAKAGVFVLRKINLEIDGLYPIFAVAIVVLGYSLCEYLGGNGYLCVYLIGIIMGNSKILHKRALVHFFDGLSWIMQIILFFTLGLLSFPSHLPAITLPGILISLFMIFIARPAATFSILSWFKIPVKQQLLVSWVGLRGSASIVFAIYVMASGVDIGTDLFHMVFFVALFSIAVQGTMIPWAAKKLDVVEPDVSVLKTFSDYQEEGAAKLIEVEIPHDSPWANRSLMDADVPQELLAVMIKRDGKALVPKGNTVILPGDIVVLAGDKNVLLPVVKKSILATSEEEEQESA